MKPLVSVIVPAWNEEKYLARCLAAIKKQDFKGEYEIIVVDSNSKDRTRKIALAAKVKCLNEPRKGAAYARQKGLMHARGEIVCQTDADTIVPPDWISRIYTRFAKEPELVGLGGAFEFSDDAGIASRLLCRAIGIFVQLFSVIITPTFLGFNHAYRRKVFIRAGGYHPDYQAFEDAKAAMTLSEYGRVRYDPAIRVKTSSRRLMKSPSSYFITPMVVGIRMYVLKKKPAVKWKAFR